MFLLRKSYRILTLLLTQKFSRSSQLDVIIIELSIKVKTKGIYLPHLSDMSQDPW